MNVINSTYVREHLEVRRFNISQISLLLSLSLFLSLSLSLDGGGDDNDDDDDADDDGGNDGLVVVLLLLSLIKSQQDAQMFPGQTFRTSECHGF